MMGTTKLTMWANPNYYDYGAKVWTSDWNLDSN